MLALAGLLGARRGLSSWRDATLASSTRRFTVLRRLLLIVVTCSIAVAASVGAVAANRSRVSVFVPAPIVAFAVLLWLLWSTEKLRHALLIGWLFGSTVDRIERTELLLLITPRVIGDPSEGQEIYEQVRGQRPGLERDLRLHPSILRPEEKPKP